MIATAEICDTAGCPAVHKVEVALGDLTLVFCLHHFDVNQPSLIAQGFHRTDERVLVEQ